jgi:hypothetical protein
MTVILSQYTSPCGILALVGTNWREGTLHAIVPIRRLPSVTLVFCIALYSIFITAHREALRKKYLFRPFSALRILASKFGRDASQSRVRSSPV